jgi:flavin-dependent dehydrogenase
LKVATDAGVALHEGVTASDVEMDSGTVKAVVTKTAQGPVTYRAQQVIIADGARSQLGRKLGREWHKDTAYGVAARAYIASERSDDEWISSHLELHGSKNEVLSGYGWIFPLANGEVNIGVGTLATSKRPADINLRTLLSQYTELRRDEWKLQGDLRLPWSALLPMGGAVSGVGGRNYMFIGDAAGCVNPLNGEGIDYGLETGRLAAQMLETEHDFSLAWPAELRGHYGTAFSIARRLAGFLTVPHLLPLAGPVGMRSRALMTVALRVMGNLVTEEDKDVVARVWRTAGKLSMKLDERVPFPAGDLRS